MVFELQVQQSVAGMKYKYGVLPFLPSVIGVV